MDNRDFDIVLFPPSTMCSMHTHYTHSCILNHQRSSSSPPHQAASTKRAIPTNDLFESDKHRAGNTITVATRALTIQFIGTHLESKTCPLINVHVGHACVKGYMYILFTAVVQRIERTMRVKCIKHAKY